MPQFLYTNSTLRARDVKALAEWYRDTLGFEIRLLWGDPPSHGIVKRDEIRLGIAPLTASFGQVSAYIHVTGVDALYAELLSRCVAINRTLERTDYRMKDFDLFDPDGNCLCIGEMIETADPD
jgi:uncharacterized glyoxalase superfamily protein PhnB